MSKLLSQDLPVDMDEMTLYKDESIFTVERIPQMPAEANDYIQMEVSFEMNLDLVTIKRTYYSLLDVLSDVGGLITVVMNAVAISLIILNY